MCACVMKICVVVDLASAIRSRVVSLGNGWFSCTVCDYQSKYKTTINRHVESKHIVTDGVQCDICLQTCPTTNALISHKYRAHGKNYGASNFSC